MCVCVCVCERERDRERERERERLTGWSSINNLLSSCLSASSCSCVRSSAVFFDDNSDSRLRLNSSSLSPPVSLLSSSVDSTSVDDNTL